MSLNPITPPDAAPGPSIAEISRRILGLIAHARVAPGDRLPTERSLQITLNVSRSRIRDALASLEAQGIIERRVGSGTYLAIAPATAMLGGTQDPLDALSPSQLIEARLTFELSLVPLIVAHATAQDLRGLRAELAAGERATEDREFEAHDAEFHRALAQAAHNPLLMDFAALISEARMNASWTRLKAQTSTIERRALYRVQHADIVAACERREPQRAEDAVRSHYQTIRQILYGA